jgi:hypothetical protein
MAKIKNYKNKKQKETSYGRLFVGVKQAQSAKMISNILVASHSTMISNGTDLEKWIISNYTNYKKIGCGFNEFLEIIKEYKKFFISRVVITADEYYKYTGKKLSGKKKTYIDFICSNGDNIFVGEIKDGDSLDTKKSDIEITSIKNIKNILNYHNIKCEAKLVLWSSNDLKTSSIKSVEANEYIIRGRDFAEKVGLDFNLIELNRINDGQDNLEFVINELKKIINIYEDETKKLKTIM